MDRNIHEFDSDILDVAVRLVRACGSKLDKRLIVQKVTHGQARKSLWIETAKLTNPFILTLGQARKSLWIETSLAEVPAARCGWSGS